MLPGNGDTIGMKGADYLLVAENIRVRYGRVEAVKGVSLRVRRGKCLGIVGESGSGKSTLARALLGLEDDVRGAVWFNGEDVLAMGRRARFAFRRRAQMVFQDPWGSLNPRMTVGRALDEALAVHRLAATRSEREMMVARWLDTVELDAKIARRFPHELSGGQRQRVNLARALCVGAEFLIADEPVSALDVSVQAQILSLLRELQHSHGITWILIGHDLAVMRAMADETLVMQSGLPMEAGDTASLFTSPQTAYTRQLLAAAPQVTRGLARVSLSPSP